MAIFRDCGQGGRERSSEDRRRHRELVEESIRNNIGGIISEESIIGQSGSKKIKIPIRGVKEYSFVFGKNKRGAATGDGDEKRGDIVGEEEEGKNNGHGRAGCVEGEEIYETEITIEELIGYLFDDLDLPDIDRKKLSSADSFVGFRKSGYQRKGIPLRLAKTKTVIEKIKRMQLYIKNHPDREDDLRSGRERFPFAEDDLRYRRLRQTRKKDFNAVVICIMDVSGSMDQTKKYMARSFYFLLYQFLRLKYANVEVVFIAHTTTAKEVGEVEFFHRGESGGTYISSGYEKALEIIEQRYNPKNWNIYAFHCSDGDNWTEDNKKAVELAARLCEICNLFGYGEIIPGYYFAGSTIKSEFMKHIKADNFMIVTMSRKDDIIKGLKKLLEKEGE
jgi:sporulation protein YhbH